MAGNTVLEEMVAKQFVRHQPSDFMVASFSDSEAAQDAYQALRSLDKQGQVKLESAVVLDRDEQGRMRVKNAMMPAWIWATIIGAGALLVGGMTAAAAWGFKAMSSRTE